MRAALAARATDAPAAFLAWALDFEKSAVGPLALEELKRCSPVEVMWGSGFATGGERGRGRIVSLEDGGKALEVLYPAGAVGPREGGVQWMTRLPPRDTYSLEYRVRFSDDFDWVRGGKLPGLGGGKAPSGGYFNPDGFTSRYMWRADGRLVVYLYSAGQPSGSKPSGVQYGEDLDVGVTLARGRHYVLRQRVTLNTPGERDGVIQVWVDDQLLLHRTDLLFRDQPGKDWQIDRFYFSTFHGGNSQAWAPSRDVTIRFDDIRVSP